jgi:hypothetical protein
MALGLFDPSMQPRVHVWVPAPLPPSRVGVLSDSYDAGSWLDRKVKARAMRLRMGTKRVKLPDIDRNQALATAPGPDGSCDAGVVTIQGHKSALS